MTVRRDRKGSMVSVLRANASAGVGRRERERGQALVEFALIVPLFLMIVVGVIQFGVALNFWLDMQRIANQGARWAVVNAYPGCDRTAPLTPACPADDTATYPSKLQEVLADERIAKGEIIDPYICFETTTGSPVGTPTVGDPVTVRMSRNFNFLSIVTFFLPGNGLNVNLHASATMRLEQEPSRFVANGPCATP